MAVSILDGRLRQDRAVFDAEYGRRRSSEYWTVGVTCKSFVEANFVSEVNPSRVQSLDEILKQPVFGLLQDQGVTVNISLVNPFSPYVATRAVEEGEGPGRENEIRQEIMMVIEWLRSVHRTHHLEAANKLWGTLAVRLVTHIDHAVFLTSNSLRLGPLPLGERADYVNQVLVEVNGTPDLNEQRFIDMIHRAELQRRQANRGARPLFVWNRAGMTFTSPYDRVFVSYNRSDQASLRKIVDILRREGVDIVWDQDERAGNWSKWIETQIAAARLVCVCVKEECGAYQLSEEFPLVQRAMKNGCRVVPVLLRPKPTIPPWLDSEQHYFLNESYSEEDVREFARYIKQMLVAER